MGDQPRLFITGGSSYLGQHLVPLAVQTGWRVIYSYFSHDPLAQELDGTQATAIQLDVRDNTAVFQAITTHQPQVIIHLAGSNRTPDMTAVITKGAKQIAQAAQNQQARLIHLSTDVIFDGQNAPYEDTAVATPLHEYGQAKAEAEKIIQANIDNHLIIRTSLIYGLRRMDRALEWITAALTREEPVTLFDNQWRNPVWVMTLAHACLELATRDEIRGILNIAGNQAVSRAELGLKLLDWWQFPLAKRHTLRIAPAPSDAPWAPDTRLLVNKATRLLQTPLLGLDAVLAQAKESLSISSVNSPNYPSFRGSQTRP